MIYLLVGIGRSGTSLLQSILYHQEQLIVYPETQLFRRLLVANPQEELDRDRLQELFRNENPRFRNLQRYVDLTVLEKESYRVEEVIELFENDQAAVLFKDARNLDYLPRISRRLPELKVICTVRDLRDVVLSRMRAAFSQRWGLLLNLVIMRFQYTSLRRYEKEGKVYFTRYEDFTHGDFRGLEPLGIVNKGLQGINLNEIAEVLFSEEELQKHKKKNRKTVDPANFNKWEKELPGRTVFLVELMFGDYLDRFGYKRNHRGRGIAAANRIIGKLFSWIYFIYYRISVYRDKRRYRV